MTDILKFEYLSQLLLDNQYIQLILKLFAHQELERRVNFKCELRELNFFTWSRTRSRHPPPARTAASTNTTSESAPSERAMSPDEAAPPPIARTRDANDISLQAPETSDVVELTTSPQPQGPPPPTSGPAPPPEVDELGYPTTAPPARPITHYSWRTFFTSINHLRILQKLLKAKPHRQLLMVQSKYSLTLKKHLRVPESLVRLYTLKIIKGQVPYCHRKWRSSNMRIITAIYLHVKPGLRDEWLSGLDVEQEIGEALPMEQALRAMTWWWHLRSYPSQMGVANRRDDEEGLSGFVRSKLEAIDRRLAEEDARFVEEMLGMHDGPSTNMSNGDGKHEEVMNGLSEEDLCDLPPEGYEAIPSSDDGTGDAAFDIEFDPFASNGHSSSPFHPNASHATTARRTSTTSTTSKPTSRRPSLKETLLGDPDPDDDFFLKELEKMDLSDRFPRSGANSREGSRAGSEGDVGEILERQRDGIAGGERDRDSAAAMGGVGNEMPREMHDGSRFDPRGYGNVRAMPTGDWTRRKPQSQIHTQNQGQNQTQMHSAQALARQIDQLASESDIPSGMQNANTGALEGRDGNSDADANSNANEAFNIADRDTDTQTETRRRQAIADKLNGMMSGQAGGMSQFSHQSYYQGQGQGQGSDHDAGTDALMRDGEIVPEHKQGHEQSQSQSQEQEQEQEHLKPERYVDDAAQT